MCRSLKRGGTCARGVKGSAGDAPKMALAVRLALFFLSVHPPWNVVRTPQLPSKDVRAQGAPLLRNAPFWGLRTFRVGKRRVVACFAANGTHRTSCIRQMHAEGAIHRAHCSLRHPAIQRPASVAAATARPALKPEGALFCTGAARRPDAASAPNPHGASCAWRRQKCPAEVQMAKPLTVDLRSVDRLPTCSAVPTTFLMV